MSARLFILEERREIPLRPPALWNLLADTDDPDREIGMPTMAFGPVVVTAEAFYR